MNLTYPLPAAVRVVSIVEAERVRTRFPYSRYTITLERHVHTSGSRTRVQRQTVELVAEDVPAALEALGWRFSEVYRARYGEDLAAGYLWTQARLDTPATSV